MDKRRVALKYMNSPVSDTHTFEIAIDENLKEFTVSVAGLHPNIAIMDPQNENYTVGKSMLNLENLKVSWASKSSNQTLFFFFKSIWICRS